MEYTRRVKRLFQTARELQDFGPVLRRYFVIGAFDGALTVLGFLFGAFAAGELTSRLVIAAGVSGGVALAVSSFVGAYEAERVERKVSLLRLKKSMLKEPHPDYIKAVKLSAYIAATVHAVAPLLAALVPIIPFFLTPDVRYAMPVSIAITLSFLFLMGAYMGSYARELIVYSGLRFVVAGLLTAIIIYLVGRTGV